MIFTFNDIVSHYKSKNCPYIKQQDLIANKYKQLFGQDIQPEQEIFLALNCISMFRPADKRHIQVTGLPEAEIESRLFARRLKQLKKLKTFLKETGIDKKSYELLYDYESMVVSYNYKNTGSASVGFQYPRIYLVLFEKEHYNFIKLIYKQEEQKDPNDYLDLRFDFSLKLDLDDTNH